LVSGGWGLGPQTPALLLPLIDIDLLKAFLALLKNNTEIANSYVNFKIDDIWPHFLALPAVLG